MDKESAIVIAPDPSRDRQVSIDPEQVIQMQKAVQNVFKQIDLSYLSAANKTLQKAMSEPLTKISQLPFQQMSESINVAMNQLRESMANIQQISLKPIYDSIALMTQQMEESQAVVRNIFEAMQSVDWDALDSLQDDEVVPKEIQVPVQRIVESVPALSAQYQHQRLTRSDVFAIIGIIISLISFSYTCIRDWTEDIQSAKQEEQQALRDQQYLDVLQSTNDAFQDGKVIILQNGQNIEDSVEPDVEGNDKESHGDTQ